jgi:hypothetical protein
VSSLNLAIGPDSTDQTAPILPDPCARCTGPLVSFEHSSHMCLASISSGWSVSDSISLWSQTDLGHYSPSGKTFYLGPHTPQTPTRDWSNTEVRSLARAPGEAPLSVYISHGRICAIASSGKSVFSGGIRALLVLCR